MKLIFYIFISISVMSISNAQITKIFDYPYNSNSYWVYEFNSGRVRYYMDLSPSNILEFYSADNLQKTYSINMSRYSFNSLYSYYIIPDMNSNGHKEILIMFIAPTTYRYYVKILDLNSGAEIVSFDEQNYSITASLFLSSADNTLKLAVSKTNVSNSGDKKYEIWSLGVSVNTLQTESNPGTAGFQLNQNFPNPFNSGTDIMFSLSQDSEVSLTIYDNSGAIVKKIVSEYLKAGKYQKKWEGKNEFGVNVSSGPYYYELVSNGKAEAKKLILLK